MDDDNKEYINYRKYCLNILFIFMVSLVSLTYIISGIIIIINDYNYSVECKGSRLVYYLIVSLILFCKGLINLCLKKQQIEPIIIFSVFISQILIDFTLAIWGSIELFNIPGDCDYLKNSYLRKRGFLSFSLQILSGIILSIILVYLFKHKLKCINNRICDIETGDNK